MKNLQYLALGVAAVVSIGCGQVSAAAPSAVTASKARHEAGAEPSCSVTLHVIPAISGGGQRCWFRADVSSKSCGIPSWSVTPDVFLQPLTHCGKPTESSDDGRGPCAYIQGGSGSYTITATAAGSASSVDAVIGSNQCDTLPD